MPLGEKPITIDFTARDTNPGKFGFKLTVNDTDDGLKVTGRVDAPNGAAERIANAAENACNRIITDYMEKAERRRKVDDMLDDVPGAINDLVDTVAARGRVLAGTVVNLFREATRDMPQG